jgi:hypothetical protein
VSRSIEEAESRSARGCRDCARAAVMPRPDMIAPGQEPDRRSVAIPVNTPF